MTGGKGANHLEEEVQEGEKGMSPDDVIGLGHCCTDPENGHTHARTHIHTHTHMYVCIYI